MISKLSGEILSAISYCHKKLIPCRCIRPENFLLKKFGDLNTHKLINIGMNKWFVKEKLMTSIERQIY